MCSLYNDILIYKFLCSVLSTEINIFSWNSTSWHMLLISVLKLTWCWLKLRACVHYITERAAEDEFVSPARAERLQIFTLNRKDWLQFQSALGLVRGRFVHLTSNDTTEKGKNIFNVVGTWQFVLTSRFLPPPIPPGSLFSLTQNAKSWKQPVEG